MDGLRVSQNVNKKYHYLVMIMKRYVNSKTLYDSVKEVVVYKEETVTKRFDFNHFVTIPSLYYITS